MKDLILKDIKVLTMVNALMPLIWWLLSYYVKVRGDTLYAKSFFYTFLFMMIFAVSLLLTKYDEGSNIDMILNSLPIDRKIIVKARYISLTLYMIFISIGFFLVFNLTNPMIARIIGSISINVFDILFIFGLALIFFSFYLPFHYLSLGKANAFNQGFFAVLIIIPALIFKYREKLQGIKLINYLLNRQFNKSVLILLGFGIGFYLLSLQVSKLIYKSKEF